MSSEEFLSFKKYFDEDKTVKAVFSGPKGEFKKVVTKPVKTKGGVRWQLERHTRDKVFHVNLSAAELLSEIERTVIGDFKQVNIVNTSADVQLLISNKGKVNVSVKQAQERIRDTNHNRVKNYIFSEGEDIAPLRDLGIFSKDNYVIKSKFDKFKQINRFIQIVDDEFRSFNKDKITILDFGCGKSYLTFLVYYYFRQIKNMEVSVIGYDIKPDVVDECNKIAQSYGYGGLCFIRADVTGHSSIDFRADMIITLHACDVATDYALFNAICSGVKYIFSVPCCQHEINSKISAQNEMKLLLTDGLIKERFSALLTDVVRCEVLRQEGYETDVIEFVDFGHSPKNLMIRAKLTGKPKRDYRNAEALLSRFGCSQKLFSLVRSEKNTLS